MFYNGPCRPTASAIKLLLLLLFVLLLLILKLKSHGMGNGIINWIEQWLTDGRQWVVVDGEISRSSLEWGPTRICTRAYFIFGIHQ